MGEVVPARTSQTLLPPSPRTVLSLSCFKVLQCINCRDWHCKSFKRDFEQKLSFEKFCCVLEILHRQKLHLSSLTIMGDTPEWETSIYESDIWRLFMNSLTRFKDTYFRSDQLAGVLLYPLRLWEGLGVGFLCVFGTNLVFSSPPAKRCQEKNTACCPDPFPPGISTTTVLWANFPKVQYFHQGNYSRSSLLHHWRNGYK